MTDRPRPLPPAVRPARRRALQLLGALSGAAGLAAAAPALAQFRLEVTGVGATQIPVTLARFRDEARAGEPISEIIRSDLERSGLFRATLTDEALDERSQVDLMPWRARGTDALVAGSATRLADGRFDLRFRLWDAVRNEQLLGQSKVVLAADLRLAAHRIADEIHQKLTGEPGANATRIAFVVRSGAKRFALHVTDADGEGGQVALASPEPIISPAWSPEGRRLAYVSFETQKAVVWVQDLQSGQRRMLANFRGSNSAPAWSPDGQRLALALSQEGLTQLYLMPAAGGTPQRLTRSSAIDTEPQFTPDGRHIVFVSDRGGGPQIYRIPAEGGNAERLSFQGNYNISPAISPDGRTLAYVHRQGNSFRLATQDIAGGPISFLTDTVDDESPSFAPNGRLIVYATKQQGRAVLMTTTLDGKIKSRLLASGAEMREPAWGPFGR